MHRHLLVAGSLLIATGALTIRAEEVSAAPAAAPEAASTELSAAELENLVARIALYPDPLIAQILPASTYPLEIVMASRLAKEKESLVKSKPEEFQKEVEKQKWDASVKAVAVCPDALKKMNDDLDWTNKLGEAFLAQQEDVLQAIQTMRAKAKNNGVLKDTPQQTLMVEQETIRILPSDPDVIYVPQYDPQVVYVQQPSTQTIVVDDDDDDVAVAVGAGVLGFGAGIAMGAWLSNDCHWGYGGGVYGHGYPSWGYAQAGYVNHYSNTNINNNFNRNNTINNGNLQNKYGNFNGQRVNSPRASTLPAGGAGAGSGRWQHNPEHRRGQGYQNNKAFDNARLGNNSGRARLNDPSRNGWGNNRPSTGGGLGSNRPSSGSGLGSNRPSSGSGLGGSRPSSGLGSGNRPSTQPSRGSSGLGGSRPSSSDRGAFSNQGRGSSTRQQSSRGNQSMNRSSASRPSSSSRPSGGASRPSGGGSRPSGGGSRPSGGGSRGGGGGRR